MDPGNQGIFSSDDQLVTFSRIIYNLDKIIKGDDGQATNP